MNEPKPCPTCGAAMPPIGCTHTGRPFFWCASCGTIKPCDDTPAVRPALADACKEAIALAPFGSVKAGILAEAGIIRCMRAEEPSRNGAARPGQPIETHAYESSMPIFPGPCRHCGLAISSSVHHTALEKRPRD